MIMEMIDDKALFGNDKIEWKVKEKHIGNGKSVLERGKMKE